MLSGSEQKVLDFILRQTIGFSKESDKISKSQFLKGIGEKNKGVGLAYGTVLDGIEGLVDKGFIWVRKEKNKTSEYGLVVQKLNESGSNLGWGGSKIGQGSGPKIEHTIDNNNKEYSIKEIERIFSFYKEKICPEEDLDRMARKVIEKRLRVFSCDQIEEAIENFSENDWRMEHNRGFGIKWFFRSDEQVRKWLSLSPSYKKEVLRRGSLG